MDFRQNHIDFLKSYYNDNIARMVDGELKVVK